MGENYFHGRVFSVKKYASAVTDDRTRVEVFIIISKQVYSILFFTSCPIKTFVVDDLGIVSTFQRFQHALDKGITIFLSCYQSHLTLVQLLMHGITCCDGGGIGGCDIENRGGGGIRG